MQKSIEKYELKEKLPKKKLLEKIIEALRIRYKKIRFPKQSNEKETESEKK